MSLTKYKITNPSRQFSEQPNRKHQNTSSPRMNTIYIVVETNQD